MNLTDEETGRIAGIWARIAEKMSAECDRIGDRIPYVPEGGRYPDMGERDICWWTNGFWPGMLWQTYEATGAEKYLDAARRVELRLDAALEEYDGLHHDVGFMFLHSAVADFRLTGNPRSRSRGMHAANLLAGRYNARGKFIRCWNGDCVGWIIVDSLMNVPLLHWAYGETGDPRFRYIATDHADSVLKHIVRDDGSCNHIAILDPATGGLVETPRGQGYAVCSSWSRGQAWGLYGFALSYRHAGEARYLEAARRIADYFVANVSAWDWVPPVDFRAPAIPDRRDTTAGACAACGLLEIAEALSELDRRPYVEAAVKLVSAIAEKHCNWDPAEDSIVGYGTAAYHNDRDNHVPIIYGDYFLIEATLRLLWKGFPIW